MIKLPEKENIPGAEDELDIAPEYSWVIVLIENPPAIIVLLYDSFTNWIT